MAVSLIYARKTYRMTRTLPTNPGDYVELFGSSLAPYGAYFLRVTITLNATANLSDVKTFDIPIWYHATTNFENYVIPVSEGSNQRGVYQLGIIVNNAAYTTRIIRLAGSPVVGTLVIDVELRSDTDNDAVITEMTGSGMTFPISTPYNINAGGAYVNLQATTPGSQQTGNTNINGQSICGILQVGTIIPTADDVNGINFSAAGGNPGKVMTILTNIIAGNADGKVGIGSQVPLTQLDMYGLSDDTLRNFRVRQFSTSDKAALVTLYKSRGTIGTPFPLVTGDNIGTIIFSGADPTNAYLTSASINCKVSGTVGGVGDPRLPTILTFHTSTDASPSVLGERMRIDEAGFVGINTSALNAACELEVSTSRNTSPRGIMSSQYTTDNLGARLHLRKGRGTIAIPSTVVTGDMLGKMVASGYDGANYLEMASIDVNCEGTIAATRVPTRLSFWTSTDAAPSVLTERMRINSAGLIAINTAGVNAVTELQVNSSSATTPRGIMSSQYSTDTNGAIINLRKGRGTLASPTIIVTGDTLGRLATSGYDGANHLEMASIDVYAEGTIAATRIPTRLSFWTATNALPSVLTERVRIDSAGVTTFNAGIVASKIYPAADSTTALQLLKADGTTAVLTVDTTNYRIGIGPTAPVALLHLSSTASGINTVLRVENGASNSQSTILAVNSAGATTILFCAGSTISTGTFGGLVNYGGITCGAGNGLKIGTTGATPYYFYTNNTEKMALLSSGNLGVGVSVPTATIQLKAGTMTASTAPLKLTTGTNLTVAEAGAIEFTTDDLYFTGTTGPTRKLVQFAAAVEDTGAGPTTLTGAYDVIVKNQGSANTINLPAATGTGRKFTIKNIGAGTITLDGNGAETIDGNATIPIIQWDSVTVQDYKSGLWVIL